MNLGIAIAIAAKGFERVVDKSGRPYILHCLRVMEEMDSDDEKMVAVLHDTVEDGVCTVDDLIGLNFSSEVVLAVVRLTHKKEVSYEDYIKSISHDKIATKVKKADLKDNSDITRLKGLTKKDFDRIEKYHKAFTYLSKV